MPKAKAKPSHAKQQQQKLTSSKPYHRNGPNKQQLKTARTHKGVAATLAKALSAQCINSMLADTASELQEAGIKQRPSSRGGCKVQRTQQQQQLQQQRPAHQPPAEQRQLRQQAVQQQQDQQPQQQQQQQPDLMSMLGSWSMRQQPDEQQQQPGAS